MTEVADTFDHDGPWTDCWQCNAQGKIANCFEDCCVCGGEDDPDTCCNPRTCDVCKGKRGWPTPETNHG